MSSSLDSCCKLSLMFSTVVSLKDSGKSWYVFNRLVDTGKILSLDIKGHYCNFEDESQENYDRIYTIAE